MGNLAQIFLQQCNDDVAIRTADDSLTYAELNQKVRQISTELSALQCQRVAFIAKNSIGWIALDLALFDHGITSLPLPTFFSDEQIFHSLNQASIDLIIFEEAYLDKFLTQSKIAHVGSAHTLKCLPNLYYLKLKPESQNALPQGTQKITFTSGSTASPKGVCLSAEHQLKVASSLVAAVNVESPVHFSFMPFSTLLENIAGIYASFMCGGCVYLSDTVNDLLFSPKSSDRTQLPALLMTLFQELHQVQPNTTILVPQLLKLLLQAVHQGMALPTSFSFVAVGGGKVSADLLNQARQLNLPVYQGYGLSECGSVVALNASLQDPIDSVGNILPHCEVSIVDGEIVVRNSTNLGYVGDPNSWTALSDPVYTGDIGELKDGYLYISGRKKNTLVLSNGRNVNPEWVESELEKFPFVVRALVLGEAKPYLSAALEIVDVGIPVEHLQQQLLSINEHLPIYAQVKQFTCLSKQQWQPYLTYNGRINRISFTQNNESLIDALYNESVTELT
ncbi:AMP-binding protein [Sessilibacter sp. MAH1]